MKKTKKSDQKPSWDDGRVVANMNVPGMPWYKEERRENKNGSDDKADKANKSDKTDKAVNKTERPTRQETMDIMLGGVGAALLVGLFFCAGIVLFVFICVTVL